MFLVPHRLPQWSSPSQLLEPSHPAVHPLLLSALQYIQRVYLHPPCFCGGVGNSVALLCFLWCGCLHLSCSLCSPVFCCPAPSCATPVFVHGPPHLWDKHVQTSCMVYMFVSQPKYLLLKGWININELPFSLDPNECFFFFHHIGGTFYRVHSLDGNIASHWSLDFYQIIKWMLFLLHCVKDQLSVYWFVIYH